MKTIVLLLALMIANSSFAKCITNDLWSGKDKTKHIAAGLAFGSAGTLAFKDPHYGFLLGAGIGLAKEAYDATGRGTCSFQDFAVTALASAAGAYGTAWVILPQKGGVFVGYSHTF